MLAYSENPIGVAYSYLRFSSKQQASGTSIQRQQDLVDQYCLDNNLELSPDSFSDLGISAFRGSNGDAALGQFLSAVQSNKIPQGSYLLVESLDRLSREEVQYALTQMLTIINSGIILVTLLDNQIYKTPVDTTQLIISLTVMERAHNESKVKSQRIRAAWDYKRKTNTKRTAQCPFWLDINRDRVTYTVNEFAGVVERMFEMYIGGMGSMAIARQLNTEGVDSPKKTAWGFATIDRTLKGLAVTGRHQHHERDSENRMIPVGAVIDDYYPAIIDQETFLKAQAVRSKKTLQSSKGSTKTHQNIFIDNTECYCGCSMILKRPRDAAYLLCRNKPLSKCDGKLIAMKTLAKFLKQYLASPMFHNSWVSSSETKKKHEDQLVSLESKLVDQEIALQQLFKAVGSNMSDVVMSEISRRSEAITELQEGIQQLQAITITDNKQQSYKDTIQLIEQCFSLDNHPENIAARNKLKAIVEKVFLKLVITRVDNPNKYFISATSIKGQMEFVTIENPTRSKLDEVWKYIGSRDEPAEPLTDEQKQEIIENHRYTN